MASNTDNGEHPFVSQDGVMVPSRAFIERFDVSRLGVGASNAAVDTPVVAAANQQVVDATAQQEDDDDDEDDFNEKTIEHSCYNSDSNDDDEQPRELFPDSQATALLATDSQGTIQPLPHAEASVPVVAKKRKARYSFSTKKLLANSDLYLLPTTSAAPTNRGLVAGQILHCPNEKNGRMFGIRWSPPFPVGIRTDMMRTQIVSDEYTRKLLQEACERHRSSTSLEDLATDTRSGDVTSNIENTTGVNTGGFTTPPPVRNMRAEQASAAMRTSVTIRSQATVSDLSSRSSSRRGTRSSDPVDSDSDDDEFDLNEAENLWHELPAPQDTVESDTEEEGREENQSHSGSLIGNILNDVTWNFEVVGGRCDCRYNQRLFRSALL
jgi:hypothetical protein